MWNFYANSRTVVKQNGPRYNWALEKESHMLQQLLDVAPGEPEVKHIVKLFKYFHKVSGTGTDPKLDPSPWTKNNGRDTYNQEKEVGR